MHKIWYQPHVFQSSAWNCTWTKLQFCFFQISPVHLQQAQENRIHTQGLSLHVSTDTLYKDTISRQQCDLSRRIELSFIFCHFEEVKIVTIRLTKQLHSKHAPFLSSGPSASFFANASSLQVLCRGVDRQSSSPQKKTRQQQLPSWADAVDQYVYPTMARPPCQTDGLLNARQ